MRKYSENRIKVPRFKEENGFYTTVERSRIMGKIKGKNSKPEVVFRKMLWQAGLRYRKNVKHMKGKPDIVMRKYKLIVFIDGEFWHGYNWQEKKKQLKTNKGFWVPKIERNMQRDEEINQFYHSRGYTVMRFWENEVKKELAVCLNEVLKHVADYEKYGNGF